MKAPKHTPGPWNIGKETVFEDECPTIEIDVPEAHHRGFVHVHGRLPESRIKGDRVGFMFDRLRADAALIAASPALLAAAIALMQRWLKDEPYDLLMAPQRALVDAVAADGVKIPENAS